MPIPLTHTLAGLVALAATQLPAHAVAHGAGHTLTNGTLTIGFATSPNYTSANSDRVDAITWQGSSGAVSNYVAFGGPTTCNDPLEFFGQAYGDLSNSQPYAVISGTLSKWSGKTTLQGKTHVTSTTVCDGTLDALTATAYTLSDKPGLRNGLKIVRKFTFKTAFSSGDLRTYVPRLPLSIYPYVLAPDTNGVVQTYNSGSCGFNCNLTNWNGKWFADDDGNGNGVAILRNPSKNQPALVLIDNDSDSESNNTSVALTLPSGGWLGTYTETQTMCFYDAKSWPAAKRNAGKLPQGCTSVPVN